MTYPTLGAHFARYRQTYHQHAHHQRQLADTLAQQLCQRLNNPVSRALEIGCGSGFLTQSLQMHWQQAMIKDYWLNDLYPVDSKLNPPTTNQHSLIGDIQALSLPNNLDLVLSSATLQWIEALDALLQKLAQAMPTGATIACSLYCGNHYQQLRQTLGIGLNYRQPPELLVSFKRYYQPLWHNETQTQQYFNSPRDVLSHIRISGVHALSAQVSFSAMRQFKQRYQALKTNKGYPLSQHAFLFIGERR